MDPDELTTDKLAIVGPPLPPLTFVKKPQSPVPESSADIHNILQRIPEAVFVSDVRGIIISVNREMECLCGYGRKEMDGLSIETLVPERHREMHHHQRQQFHQHRAVRPMGAGLEVSLLRKDGTEIPVEISLGPLGDSGQLFSVVADITERKRMQAELEEARMQMVLSDRLASLGMMAGCVAHEINNPLAIIHGIVSGLAESAERDDLPKATLVRDCGRILETTERIATIIASMRLISRDGSRDPFREIPLCKMINEVVELFKDRFFSQNIVFEKPELDDSLRIRCREVQIAQVLLNLLQNAVAAINERTRVAPHSPRWIRIEALATEFQVSVDVLDSGIGVPPHLVSRIMEPFFTTKDVGHGTGLGLSVSQAIAREHNGDLKLGDRSGHTCFSLILPFENRRTNPCD